MGTDADLARTRSIYEVCRDAYDDETGGNTDRKIEALRRAVGDLARRVSRLEQTLDVLKNGSPGKSPQRNASAGPAHRPVPGRAPGETLHRRAKIRIRTS
jgi:hypothetical protein